MSVDVCKGLSVSNKSQKYGRQLVVEMDYFIIQNSYWGLPSLKTPSIYATILKYHMTVAQSISLMIVGFQLNHMRLHTPIQRRISPVVIRESRNNKFHILLCAFNNIVNLNNLSKLNNLSILSKLKYRTLSELLIVKVWFILRSLLSRACQQRAYNQIK